MKNNIEGLSFCKKITIFHIVGLVLANEPTHESNHKFVRKPAYELVCES